MMTEFCSEVEVDQKNKKQKTVTVAENSSI